MTPLELFDQAVVLRKQNRFGEAINAFTSVADHPDCPQSLRLSALASIELIREINGFVNADLMNP